MPGWTVALLVVLAVAVAVTAVALLRTAVRLKALETARSQPDQALLLLQREIEASRSESLKTQADTLASLRAELHQFTAQMGARMGEVGSGVSRELQHVTSVVGQVEGSLGKLGETTQRVLEVGKDIAGLEQILKAPKLRGGLGETFLAELLGQILPREQYLLQHQFRSGEKVDAAIRLGEGLIPVDAKFPLENFRRMLEETEEDRRRAARRAFARDVKARVDEIAKKYILPDEGTFDFGLMYIPAENVYYEIVVRDDKSEDEPLLTYALGRRVIPVSPNSFYAYLQTILLGLKGLRIERNAAEIMTLLGRLQGDLEKFREQFDVVGRHLTNAKNKYDEAAATLARFETKLEAIGGRGEQPALPGLTEP